MKYKLRVDPAKIRLSDWTLISVAPRTVRDMRALMEFFDRVVIGGVDNYRIEQMPDVIQAVAGQLVEMASTDRVVAEICARLDAERGRNRKR